MGKDNWQFERRQVLQAAEAGIGALSLANFGGEIASAKTGCANGPFEATYEPGVVNVGQIRADQAKGKDPGPMGAASPSDTDDARDSAMGGGVQQIDEDEDGPLSILTEYDGVNSLETRGGVPSDSQVAVGDGKLLHVLNRNIAIYNKEAGRREQFFRLERLWEPVIPKPEGGFVFGLPFVFDPRARYDRNNNRFIICATQFQFGIEDDGTVIDREDLEEAAGPEEGNEGKKEEDEEEDEKTVDMEPRPPKGWFLVAVSATSNPNGRWYVYRIPPEDKDGEENDVSPDNNGLVDYPTLGFDKDAIYMTQNFFGENKFEVTMVTLDKAAMYAGEEVTAYHFDGMADSDADGITFTVQPAQQPFSGGESGTYYLINSDFPFPDPTPETLTLWELSDPLDEPSLECFTLDVDPYSFPPPARQKGGDETSFLDTLGTRVMNAYFDDGSLWTAHSAAILGKGGRPVAAIRWYEIDVASRSVVQSGTFGTPNRSTFMPTVGADDGRTVIVHNVSGPDTYPRMDVACRTANTPDGELDGSTIIEEGNSPYDYGEGFGTVGNPLRWGDYNGVSVDPSAGTFWTVSQYSPDIDIPPEADERDPYFTRIAEVEFDDGGPGNGRGGGPGN